MKKLLNSLFLTVLIHSGCNIREEYPISLHPENTNYFLYKGKPTILITSAEHYGAVMNMDFDYVKYLNALKKTMD